MVLNAQAQANTGGQPSERLGWGSGSCSGAGEQLGGDVGQQRRHLGHRRVDERPLADPDGDPEAHVLAADRRTRVLAALDTLPPDQKAALVLVDMEVYAVAEAAHILEVPPGTVKSRCARGRARLASLLAESLPAAAAGALAATAPAATLPGDLLR